MLGKRVTIYGDHTAVRWIFNKVDITRRHVRWKVTLSEFDYKIISRPGTANTNADALSQIPYDEEEKSKVDQDEGLAFRAVTLHTRWAEDPWYKSIYLYLETLSYHKATTQERRQIREKAKRFLIKNNRLYHRDSDGGIKMCIGKEDVELVLKEYHDGAQGGHFGRDLTISRVREGFWWPTLWRDVTEYIKTCDICQRYGP